MNTPPRGTVSLNESYTIDLWPWEGPAYDPEARQYRVALSATGSEWLDELALNIGYAHGLIVGTIVCYVDDGEGFIVLPESIEHLGRLQLIFAMSVNDVPRHEFPP